MDLSKISVEDKDKILGTLLPKLIWVDQFMGHGHWKMDVETEELLDVVEILDKYFAKKEEK